MFIIVTDDISTTRIKEFIKEYIREYNVKFENTDYDQLVPETVFKNSVLLCQDFFINQDFTSSEDLCSEVILKITRQIGSKYKNRKAFVLVDTSLSSDWSGKDGITIIKKIKAEFGNPENKYILFTGAFVDDEFKEIEKMLDDSNIKPVCIGNMITKLIPDLLK